MAQRLISHVNGGNYEVKLLKEGTMPE